MESDNLYSYAGSDPVNRWDPLGTYAGEDAMIRSRVSIQIARPSAQYGMAPLGAIALWVACELMTNAEAIALIAEGAVQVEPYHCGARGRKCFAAGTPVSTADGTRAIGEVEAGDLVVAHLSSGGGWVPATPAEGTGESSMQEEP